MKKTILGTAITLAILFTGCNENTEEKQVINNGKLELMKYAEIDFDKARIDAEKSYSKEEVQKWIDEEPRLKELEKEYKEFNDKQGKHIDWSKFDWSVGKEREEKK